MPAQKWIRLAAYSALCCAFASTVAHAADGLGLPTTAGETPWVRWQGRLFLGADAPGFRAELGGAGATGLQIRRVSLLGDFYVTRSLIGKGIAGGLHATSGLLLSPRAEPWVSAPAFGTSAGAYGLKRPLVGQGAAESGYDALSTVPYLGFGYAGASAQGGWSFSADLGLVALAASNAVKFGQVFKGTSSVDDVVREMRVAPVLQLGLSYAF